MFSRTAFPFLQHFPWIMFWFQLPFRSFPLPLLYPSLYSASYPVSADYETLNSSPQSEPSGCVPILIGFGLLVEFMGQV